MRRTTSTWRPFDGATERGATEADHALQGGHAEHELVNADDVEHR
jgi:hypothetical protein